VRATINNAFGPVAEAVANEMDAMTYRKIVALHAAISYFLVETARPLPRMLRYRFGQVMTTLTIGQKLYADALRGDEVRAENKIVHPAFAPMQGRALSS
jgi:prophage DNA circulation protein